MGEGTPLHALTAILGSLLHPHPLADADTPRCKLAKASLLGEGHDEGRKPANAARALRSLVLDLHQLGLIHEAEDLAVLRDLRQFAVNLDHCDFLAFLHLARAAGRTAGFG